MPEPSPSSGALATKAIEAVEGKWERPWMKASARNRLGVGLIYALLVLAAAINEGRT